jgi:hypothetical protein
MSGLFSTGVRTQVAERASYRCEYCLIKEEDSFLPFHVDHVMARKHGGSDALDNLAYACPHCNQHKGTDLTTYLHDIGEIVPIYHPREDEWDQHFSIELGRIVGLTRKGRATVQLLHINQPERLLIRQVLMEAGLYP